MIDLDEALRADAERWRADLPPVAGLDALVTTMDRDAPRRRWLLPALAAAVVAALAVGLAVVAHTRTHAAPPAADLAEITGVVWKDTASVGTLAYTGTTVRVFDGCTTTLHRLVVERDSLELGESLDHAFPCVAIGNAGFGNTARFQSVVAGPVAWSRTGNTLLLSNPEGGQLTLTTDGAPAPEATGTHWLLVRYSGAEQHSQNAVGSYGFHIGPNGEFEVDYSCGNVTGTADVGPATIVFDATIFSDASHGAGDCDSFALSNVVRAVILGGFTEYTIQGTQLFLRDGDGRELVYDAA